MMFFLWLSHQCITSAHSSMITMKFILTQVHVARCCWNIEEAWRPIFYTHYFYNVCLLITTTVPQSYPHLVSVIHTCGYPRGSQTEYIYVIPNINITTRNMILNLNIYLPCSFYLYFLYLWPSVHVTFLPIVMNGGTVWRGGGASFAYQAPFFPPRGDVDQSDWGNHARALTRVARSYSFVPKFVFGGQAGPRSFERTFKF